MDSVAHTSNIPLQNYNQVLSHFHSHLTHTSVKVGAKLALGWSINNDYLLTDINIAEEMDDLDDCFCVTKGRNKVCHGENCHGMLNFV